MIEIQIQVVADIEIQKTILIVVAKRGRSTPPAISDSSSFRHVAERPVSVVTVQKVRTQASEIDVRESVVVVIREGDPHSPPWLFGLETRLRRDIFECPISFVTIERRTGILTLPESFQCRSLNQQDVYPTIIVKVEGADTASLGFENVPFLQSISIEVRKGDPRRGSNVGELRDWGSVRGRMKGDREHCGRQYEIMVGMSKLHKHDFARWCVPKPSLSL